MLTAAIVFACALLGRTICKAHTRAKIRRENAEMWIKTGARLRSKRASWT